MNTLLNVFVRHKKRYLVITAVLQWAAVFLLRFTYEPLAGTTCLSYTEKLTAVRHTRNNRFEEDSNNEGLCKSKRNAEITAEVLHAVALATALAERREIRLDVVRGCPTAEEAT